MAKSLDRRKKQGTSTGFACSTNRIDTSFLELFSTAQSSSLNDDSTW